VGTSDFLLVDVALGVVSVPGSSSPLTRISTSEVISVCVSSPFCAALSFRCAGLSQCGKYSIIVCGCRYARNIITRSNSVTVQTDIAAGEYSLNQVQRNYSDCFPLKLALFAWKPAWWRSRDHPSGTDLCSCCLYSQVFFKCVLWSAGRGPEYLREETVTIRKAELRPPSNLSISQHVLGNTRNGRLLHRCNIHKHIPT
jgi:hypothetical protein